MEILGIIDLPRWLLFILAFITTVIVYTVWKKGTFKRLGVRTKPTSFILGDLGDMAKKGLAMYNLDMVNKYGKVFGTFWGNKPVMIISDVEMIKQITTTEFSNFPQRFSFRETTADINLAVTSAKGHHWTFLRNNLSSSFSTGKLRTMNRHITRCLEKLHKNLDEQSTKSPDGVDVYYYFTAYTLDVICSTGFGIDVDSQGDPNNPFITNAKKFMNSQFAKNPFVIFKAVFPDLPGLDFVKVRQFPQESMDFFKTATKNIMEERKKSSSDSKDLLQIMINSQKEDSSDISTAERQAFSLDDMQRTGLTDTEVVANSMMFMFAGFDTTAAVLGWAAYDLALNTVCQDKLIKEIDSQIGEEVPNYDSVFKLQYLDMVVKETLRLHPVGIGVFRHTVKTTNICGVTIPEGMWVLVPVFPVHYMSEYWEHPHRYQPERFAPENKNNLQEYAYMPFGMGPRNCIGIRLALYELKMTIVSLLQKYRIVKSDKLTVPMAGSTQGICKPSKPVFVKLLKRKE